MELELKTGNNQTSAKPQAAPPPETQKPAASAAPNTSQGGSPASTQTAPGTAPGAQTGSPADKPGRRAAAAKKAERQASAKKAEAEKAAAAAAPVAEKVSKYEAAIASGDVDKILDAFGITDEKLVDLYIAKHGSKDDAGGTDGGDKAVEELRVELAKFKEELADSKTKEAEKAKQTEAEAAIRGHVDQLRTLASKPEHAERFELVNAAEPDAIRVLTDGQCSSAYEAAFDVMVEVHKAHGKYITHEEALDALENALLGHERARAERTGKLKKLGAAAAKPEAKPEAKKPQEKAPEASDPVERMRAAFKAQRPRVTNSLSTFHATTSPRAGSKSEADKRFRDRVLGMIRGEKPN